MRHLARGAVSAAIRPFRVNVPQQQLAALRDHLAATRLPSKELVADRSQGVQLATIPALARLWATKYDWRACEARLNALPQYTTEIFSTQVRGAWKISPGNVVKPTGTLTGGGAWPPPSAVARALSRYDRAAEAPVSQ